MEPGNRHTTPFNNSCFLIFFGHRASRRWKTHRAKSKVFTHFRWIDESWKFHQNHSNICRYIDIYLYYIYIYISWIITRLHVQLTQHSMVSSVQSSKLQVLENYLHKFAYLTYPKDFPVGLKSQQLDQIWHRHFFIIVLSWTGHFLTLSPVIRLSGTRVGAHPCIRGSADENSTNRGELLRLHSTG